MLYWHDHKTERRWLNGEFKVRLDSPTSDRPLGYCDGTDDDVAQLQSRAEEEGLFSLTIKKRYIKKGREVWLVGDPPEVIEGVDDY